MMMIGEQNAIRPTTRGKFFGLPLSISPVMEWSGWSRRGEFEWITLSLGKYQYTPNTHASCYDPDDQAKDEEVFLHIGKFLQRIPLKFVDKCIWPGVYGLCFYKGYPEASTSGTVYGRITVKVTLIIEDLNKPSSLGDESFGEITDSITNIIGISKTYTIAGSTDIHPAHQNFGSVLSGPWLYFKNWENEVEDFQNTYIYGVSAELVEASVTPGSWSREALCIGDITGITGADINNLAPIFITTNDQWNIYWRDRYIYDRVCNNNDTTI